MIQVNNLVKEYGKHLAVNQLNFHIEKGKIYGFLGPNGAGKSTTMNILTGYIGATSGSVMINGHDISKEPEKAKACIGYLPELPPLYPDMKVIEYLNFAAELKKIKKSERAEQIAKVMDMVDITDVSNRLIRNLSKGYKQRIGLAQAILGFPEIIILDEPTVGLDPKQISEIRELIKELGKEHTVILSSHILSEISAVCDQIIIIANGKLVADDSAQNLLKEKSSTQTLTIELKGEEEFVKETLETLDYIKSYSIMEAKEKNSESISESSFYILHAAEGKDIREDLFYDLAEKRIPILEMTYSMQSIEDIYMKLTREEEENVCNL